MSQPFQPFHQSFGQTLLAESIEIVTSQFLIGRSLSEKVVENDDQRMADGDGGPLLAAPSGEPPKLGR